MLILTARDAVEDRVVGLDAGAGLGLAIARWAVEANGGEIAFVDREGPGARCRITLPPPS